LTLKIITSGASRNATLQSGGIDGYQSIEVPVLAQAQKFPDTTVLLGETGGEGWFLNTAQAPTNDVRVREALAYATDRNAIMAAQGGGNLLSARTQYFSPHSPYYSASAASQYPDLDPTKAKSILKEYVNDPKRSDGKPVGSPVSIQLSYLAGDPASGGAVQLAQQQWDAVGFKVTLASFDEATLIGNALKGETQAFWFAWGSNVPYALFNHNYLPPKVDPTNWTKLDDPVVETQIAKLATCTTASCTDAATQTIDEQFDKQLPVIFLMSSEEGWAINTSKVGGAQLDPAAAVGLDPELDFATLYAKG
jgi:peptide/nickel transport system substrate-binding protein